MRKILFSALALGAMTSAALAGVPTPTNPSTDGGYVVAGNTKYTCTYKNGEVRTLDFIDVSALNCVVIDVL